MYKDVKPDEKGIIERVEVERITINPELSLIELCRLKNDYVIPAINEGLIGNLSYVEAAVRFLIDYYGIPANDPRFVQQLDNEFAPKVREYLRLIQEKSHLP